MKNPRSFVPRQRRQEQQRAGRGPPGAPIKERESSVDLAIASPGGGTASRECGSRKQKRLPRPSHRIAAIERGDARDRKSMEIPVPEERAPASQTSRKGGSFAREREPAAAAVGSRRASKNAPLSFAVSPRRLRDPWPFHGSARTSLSCCESKRERASCQLQKNVPCLAL